MKHVQINLKEMSLDDAKLLLVKNLTGCLELNKREDFAKKMGQFFKYVCTDNFLTGQEASILLAELSLLAQAQLLFLMDKAGLLTLEDMEKFTLDLLKENNGR